MENRDNLPFRKNCEGYFIDNEGNILAKDSGKGYVIFPGGGIGKNELITTGMLRETKEETGAIIYDLQELGVLEFLWGPDWAKTEKQKERYKKYRGDKMYFFTGKIKDFDCSSSSEEDSWQGKKLMSLFAALDIIEKNKPYREDIKDYRESQILFLQKLLKKYDATKKQ